MDKQKEVEEMAIIIEHACDDCDDLDDCLKCPHKCNEYYDCGNEKTATILYEKGYRKIPEGAVVLTREEYKELYDSERASYYRAERLVIDNDLLARKLTDARKETAREILSLLYTAIPKTQIVVEIKKRYGVEVGND